ncbi:MAG: hypothetical protein JWM80_4759 [Cyanobacteria bacterium RYN_339]|nr:hypothetical protein [Cyanobacteria bacterium RYN_339]
MKPAISVALLACLAGCGSPALAVAPGALARSVTLTVHPAPLRQVLAPTPFIQYRGTPVHRWTVADLGHYSLKLLVMSPAGWQDAGAAVDVPVTNGVAQPASFANLQGGRRYMVEVQAWGNQGGAPAVLLNAAHPAAVEADFTSPDADVATTAFRSVAVGFDDVPFQGTLDVTVTGFPANPVQALAQLWANNGSAPVATSTFALDGTAPSSLGVSFQHLAAGTPFFVKVYVLDQDGLAVARATSANVTFDATTADALPNATVTLPLIPIVPQAI